MHSSVSVLQSAVQLAVQEAEKKKDDRGRIWREGQIQGF